MLQIEQRIRVFFAVEITVLLSILFVYLKFNWNIKHIFLDIGYLVEAYP